MSAEQAVAELPTVMHQSFDPEPAECPGSECPMCIGAACLACGAGITHYGGCEHDDVIERHKGFDE